MHTVSALTCPFHFSPYVHILAGLSWRVDPGVGYRKCCFGPALCRPVCSEFLLWMGANLLWKVHLLGGSVFTHGGTVHVVPSHADPESPLEDRVCGSNCTAKFAPVSVYIPIM